MCSLLLLQIGLLDEALEGLPWLADPKFAITL
jgi:hypothetical protein